MSAPPRFTDLPSWFHCEEVSPGIHRITEPYYREDYRCNIYVIPGREQDIVLDTGLGLAPLRLFIQALAPNPLLVSSHSHYDHIGSNFRI